jgi:hypothetical protein
MVVVGASGGFANVGKFTFRGEGHGGVISCRAAGEPAAD